MVTFRISILDDSRRMRNIKKTKIPTKYNTININTKHEDNMKNPKSHKKAKKRLN